MKRPNKVTYKVLEALRKEARKIKDINEKIDKLESQRFALMTVNEWVKHMPETTALSDVDEFELADTARIIINGR